VSTGPQLPQGYVLHAFDRVESTNDEARRLAEQGAAAGAVVVAAEQVKGRGRHGRAWASPPGNLYASLLLRPDCRIAAAAQLSLVASLALAEALVALAPPDADVRVKWPNDVLVRGAKVAGLLLESASAAHERVAWVVVGSGVNIASAPADTLYPATALWGSQAGSLLFWAVVLSLFAAAAQLLTPRRYRERPEQVVVEESHQVEVQRQHEALALAEAALGWQVYGVNDLELSLEAVVWGYRGQYQAEKGFSRLKGCPLSLRPMYLAKEERMLGLVLLLSVALRVLTVLQWQVRRQLHQSGEVLRGLYPGQPGRKTASPSAELLLTAFGGICLTVLEVAGQRSVHITALKPLQQKLLALWRFPAELYQRLAALHFPEPPPVFSEP
jgi:hypothetical protein